jgi:predicted RNA methylase
VRVFGTTRGKDWSRPVQASDKALLRRIAKAELSPNIPLIEVPWGDLYRSGYHQGISHLHHFYTKRNLAIFAKLWQLSEASPVRDAIRFWLLSYNASHATIMTRVVAKKNQNELVLTSSQSGVLYVSGLPVEKNLFSGLRRKLKTIHAAFTELQGLGGMVDVQQGSCLFTGLPEKSIDYVFTDPPFGGNIPYGEVNFLNEAWLGACTNTKDEVTISRAQEKTVFDYEALMAQALLEVRRILRQRGNATVVFHSSSAEVWNTLQKAYRSAGFKVELASVLDKVQGSFKQVTADGAVKGDPILLLGKAQMKTRNSNRAISPVVDELIRRARASSDPAEQTPQRLYSRFVNHYLTNEQTIPLDASQFYQLISLDSQ